MAKIIHTTLKCESLPEEKRNQIFNLADESTFRKNYLFAEYEKMSKALRQRIEEEAAIVGLGVVGAVTVDLWTDRYRGRHYIAVYFQYNDDDFELHCFCLGCRQIRISPVDHSVCSEMVSSILGEYGITPRNVMFTTDSDAKLKKACLLNSWDRIACFAHDLHLLIMRDAFAMNVAEIEVADDNEDSGMVKPIPEVMKLLKSCRSLVEYFKRGDGQSR